MQKPYAVQNVIFFEEIKMKPINYDIMDQLLWLVYLFKSYYDMGKKEFVESYSNTRLYEDLFYEIFFDALYHAAEITDDSERVYTRNGYQFEYDEVNMCSFSCKEMQEYFKIARKLHRLRGGRGNNPYLEAINEEVEELLDFESYCFDYVFRKKRTSATLDILWGYEFTEEILMCVWVAKTIELFKERLPKLKEEYRKARREKRCRPKGGILCAA